MTLRRFAHTLALTLCASPALWAADVLVVDSAGGGAYTSIQAAVLASQDGDIVLVRAGSYVGNVNITGRSLTLVGEGNPRLAGFLRVIGLAATGVVQIAGFVIEPPSSGFPPPGFLGAIDIRNALGPVRVQDCQLRGAYSAGVSPYWSWCGCGVGLPDGGPGLLAKDCADVALIDCVVEGGEGSLSAIAPSGYGGDGVIADGVAHVSLVRTVARGGQGGLGDDPGSGGAGVRLVRQTTLNIAYSALFGGRAGCWAGFIGTPSWFNTGGIGLANGPNSTTYDFEGLFFAGEAAPSSCVPQASNIASFPGLAQSGMGALIALGGYPNALRAPTLVREGQPWSFEVLAPAGEAAQLRWSGVTGFQFHPRLEQPRFVGAQSITLVGPPAVVPGSQHLVLPQAPFQLGATTLGDTLWVQAVVGPVGGAATLSSARFVVRLDGSL